MCVPVKFPNGLCVVHVLEMLKITIKICSSSLLLKPKYDMLPAMDVLKEYLGLIQEFPDVHDIHKGAVSKVRDCERMKEEGRIDVSYMKRQILLYMCT